MWGSGLSNSNATPAPLSFTSGATNVRILHVEDDADTRALVALVLQSEGWEVVSVDNASSALTSVGAREFDLYLIDNWIEGDTGGGLCRRLRAADPHTPILFYSGAVYPADIETALSSGAQGYLEKPCSPDALIEEIVKLTRGHKE
jgi:CheY-like chemotaxis protein